MKFRGGEFSTGTMRNFQPELTIWRIGFAYLQYTALGEQLFRSILQSGLVRHMLHRE
jgi:hypothetical protein